MCACSLCSMSVSVSSDDDVPNQREGADFDSDEVML